MDKGDDADAVRNDLADRDSQAVVPGRSNRRVGSEHDGILYSHRSRIAHMFGLLRINRSIAARNDQFAASFLRMVHIASARYRLEFTHAATGVVQAANHG